MDIAGQVAAGPKSLWAFVKAHWIVFVAVIVLVLGAGLRYRDTLASRAKTVLPTFMKTWLKVAAFALAGAGLLHALVGDGCALALASRACAGHGPCGVMGFGIWKAVLMLLGSGVAFGITQMLSPDPLDMKTDRGATHIGYTPGAAQTIELFVDASQNRTSDGRPYVATAMNYMLDTTIEQATTGNHTLYNDDMARLLESLEIYAPNAGTLLDSVTATGPILDLIIRFVSGGYCPSGDYPIDSIVVPTGSATDLSFTKYFTYPFAQRWLDNPLRTCPWLGILDNAVSRVRIAASTALAAASTAAVSKSASSLRGYVSFVRSPVWFQPLIPYWRLHQPSSGTNAMDFQGFGASGPECTDPEDAVHTIAWLTSLKGLGGNFTVDQLVEIKATALGLPDAQNVDALVRETVAAEFDGAPGSLKRSDGGNWQMSAANNGGMGLSDLLAFYFRSPSLAVNPTNLPTYTRGKKVSVNITATPQRTGADQILYGSLRKASAGFRQKWRDLSGGNIPLEYGAALHHTKASKGV